MEIANTIKKRYSHNLRLLKAIAKLKSKDTVSRHVGFDELITFTFDDDSKIQMKIRYGIDMTALRLLNQPQGA